MLDPKASSVEICFNFLYRFDPFVLDFYWPQQSGQKQETVELIYRKKAPGKGLVNFLQSVQRTLNLLVMQGRRIYD
jgi:hypothetical protein